MSGVIVSMRRTLLSCTSLARKGLVGAALAALLPAAPASAADLVDTLSTLLDLNRQEIAALATALALLGFSVVAAIQLMRTRVRTAKNEARLRARIGELQLQSDRFGALLFAEPQILISWPAGDDRPQISGDISLVLSRDSSAQRVLAFGTWLPPEPALQMDHAVDALREHGDGFQLNLTTASGRTLEAIGLQLKFPDPAAQPFLVLRRAHARVHQKDRGDYRKAEQGQGGRQYRDFLPVEVQ